MNKFRNLHFRHFRRNHFCGLYRIATRTTACTSFPDFAKERTAKHFNHEKFEVELYNWWETQGYFQPSKEEKGAEAYTVIMPPPNVTGRLHMGHAVYASIQDLLCRYHRMLGKSTLWLPGSDHAGIATQYVVMQKLRSEGVDMEALTREDFLEHAWKYKDEKGGEIFHQLRRLGASADWTRSKFTLDEDMQAAVVAAFERLHERGLVYRGSYMVNWSPALRTALSDLEVDNVEEEGRLFFFKYVLVDDCGRPTTDFLPVSTTRPETIPGDCAVCVHPQDSRYSHLVGRRVQVPLSDRCIPVLADDYVDMEFGTGVLKITPAHDQNDFEIGKRHKLESVSVMNPDGTMNSHAGTYQGQDRFECRESLWGDMRRAGLVLREEKHRHRVPRSQRGGDVVEPRLSEQWFLRMDSMAARAVMAVQNQDIKILPNKFEKMWFNWLENNRDWCISRQLWWGHRMPIYYVDGDRSKWVVAGSDVVALQRARVQFGESVATVVQDSDVLDTWFSSALWPFITLGWPGAEEDIAHSAAADYRRFYPTSVLETGHDILFFWVARMAMLGLELTDRAPFHTVYLHGLVRDKNHEKMSKTKGNVVDPIGAIDDFGCDALRFALISGLSPGQDVAFDVERVKQGRNFANKLWNLGKYIESAKVHGQDIMSCDFSLLGKSLSLPERYILARCHQTVASVTHSLENYHFAEAATIIHDFVWNEFADWFVEINKTKSGECGECEQSQRVLEIVWDRCLHMLHPFMPFLTETLWLQRGGCESLMVSTWPAARNDRGQFGDEGAIEGFEVLQALVRAVRAVRTEYQVESNATICVLVNFSRKGLAEKSLSFADFDNERDAIALLSRVSVANLDFNVVEDIGHHSDENCVHVIVNQACEIFIPLHSILDKNKEMNRIHKQIEKISKGIFVLKSRLENKSFVSKAQPRVIEESSRLLIEQQSVLSTLESSLADLKIGK